VQQKAEVEASCVPACRKKEVPVRVLIRNQRSEQQAALRTERGVLAETGMRARECPSGFGTQTVQHTETHGPSPSRAARGRSSLAFLVSLVSLAAFFALPSAARAQAPCPNEQLRVENHSTGLPDCRAYEIVTPPQKNGALIGELLLGNRPAQISRDGRRVIAPSLQCFAGPESCGAARESEGAPYEFARTAAGWVTHPLAPPASFETYSWWNINADAPTALFSVPSAPQSQAEDFAGRSEQGSFVNVGPVGENANANYTSFLNEGTVSTADLSHVVYELKKHGKQPPAWSFDHSENRALYEYVGAGNAAPLMVGVTGGFENGENHNLVSVCGTELGGEFHKQNASLSADGRTVYFTAQGHTSTESCALNVPAPAANELWARIDGELPDAHSVLISGATPEACSSTECEKNATEEGTARDANFEFASADGSRVLFTDTQQLTNGASEDPSAKSSAALGCTAALNNTPGTGGCNLYESECPNGKRCAQPAERRLIDVSQGPGGAPVAGGPRVQGVVAFSSDGSHVYFIAKSVLTGEQENQNHEQAQDGKENLYVYAEGHVAFVATLSIFDLREWNGGAKVANVTPTGRFLVFTSRRALTPDDTCVEAEENTPVCLEQVFEYDAQTRGLIRLSIGEKGFNDNGNQGVLGGEEGGAEGFHFGDPLFVEPHSVAVAGTVPLRLDPTMSDDGAFVFFQSPVALTPGALNDVPVGGSYLAENIYEYHEGHVSLISDGKDATHTSRIAVFPVELLGSDTAGANVFFTTFDPLVAQDTDTQRDIYDARIEGGLPAPVSSPSCEGEACQAAPAAPPLFGAPSSSTFSGPGNPAIPPPVASGSAAGAQAAAQAKAAKLARALKACHARKNKRKRASCEKQARKLYATAATAKRASGK
jgi:hypothetical protein